MCAESRVAKGGQSIDEFGTAELGFEFPDATHHNALEVCDDGSSGGVCVFEPGERAAKMPQLIKSGRWARRWWILGCHESQKEFCDCAAKL